MATLLAVLRQFSLTGKILKLVYVRADNKAYDLVGTHLIESMLVVVRNRIALFLIAAVGQEPALRRLGNHTLLLPNAPSDDAARDNDWKLIVNADVEAEL